MSLPEVADAEATAVDEEEQESKLMTQRRNRGVVGIGCTTYYNARGVAVVQSLSHGKPAELLQMGATQYPELYDECLMTVAATEGHVPLAKRERRALELVDKARADARDDFPAVFAPLRAMAHAALLTERATPLFDESALGRARAEEKELLLAETMLIVKVQADYTRAMLDFNQPEPPELPHFFRDKVVIHASGHPPTPTVVRTTAEGLAKLDAAARAAAEAMAAAAAAEREAADRAEAEAVAARERARETSMGLLPKKKRESEKDKAARLAAEDARRRKKEAEDAAALARAHLEAEEARAPTFQIIDDDALAVKLREVLRLQRGVSGAARGLRKAVEVCAREAERQR